MERYWVKRKLLGLFQGDVETVRQWQLQYGRFLYTWLYYQLNKDEIQAAALTGQTLCQALRGLCAFDPDQTTMFLWLKENASRHLQAFLTQSGLKVQRPWAWSEIPPNILDSLRRIRNEALNPEVPGWGAVTEMVQATLADLSEQDRNLLIRRYTRLDTPEHIASESGLSMDKLNQQLYLARHAFRRGLFFLLQSTNPEMTESTVAGGMELFESNLETLMRSIPAAAVQSSDSSEQIKREVLEVCAEIAQNPAVSVNVFDHHILKVGLTICIVLIMVVGGWFWIRSSHPPVQPEESVSMQVAQQETDKTQQTQESPVDQEEVKRVLELGIKGDVEGLLNVLKSGGFVAQMTAAHFLGQIGDRDAIVPLMQANARWYPDEPQETPFSRAVEEILTRMNAPEISEEPVALEPEPEKPTLPETAAKPALLSGRVVDIADKPLAGIEVTLLKTNPAQETTTPLAGFSSKTDPEGRYEFESLPDGLFFVVVHDPQQRVAETRRMMWLVKETPCILNFGGQASVSGAILVDQLPLSEQTLLLSDSFNNPVHGIFTTEMQMDTDGGFLFANVPPGVYGLFSRYTVNRWTLLSQVEVAAADVTAVFEQSTGVLVVRAGDLPESLRLTAVSLRYSPDSSDVLAEWTGVRSEVDTVFEVRRVLPGVYALCADFSNGVRTLQNVVVTEQNKQDILLDAVPFGNAGMEGHFLSAWPEGLTLESADGRVRVGVMPDEGGRYSLEGLPAGMYSLGVTVNGAFVSYLDFGLFENQPAVYDPDPVQLAKTRSAVYLFATDAEGRGVAGGQVWLSHSDGVTYTASPYGWGYFAAVPAGKYIVTGVFPGEPPAEQEFTVPDSTVQAARSETNTHIIRLGR